MTDERVLLSAFRFRIELTRSTSRSDGRPAETGPGSPASGDADGDDSRLGDGGFQECQGLEIELRVDAFEEGGRNDRVVQRMGRATFPPLVLKRGMLRPVGGPADRALWIWIQDVVTGVRPVRRYDGTVEVLDRTGEQVVARWSFARGLPAKLVGPQLDGRTGEIAMEELHIAHEGLRMEEVSADARG
ncbi:MAG: phage tail protein [Acidimicrobiales bacterium]